MAHSACGMRGVQVKLLLSLDNACYTLEKFRVEALYSRHYLYLYCLVVVMFQSSDLPEDLKYWKHADREGDSLLLFSFAQFSLGLN